MMRSILRGLFKVGVLAIVIICVKGIEMQVYGDITAKGSELKKESYVVRYLEKKKIKEGKRGVWVSNSEWDEIKVLSMDNRGKDKRSIVKANMEEMDEIDDEKENALKVKDKEIDEKENSLNVSNKENEEEKILDINSKEKEEETEVFTGNEKISKNSVIPKTLGRVPGGVYLTVEAKIYNGEKAEVILDNKVYPMEQVESQEYLRGKMTQFAKYRAFIKLDKKLQTTSLGRVVVRLENKKEMAYGGEIVVIGESERLKKDLVVREYSAKIYSGEDTTYIPLENLSSIPKDTILKGENIIHIDDKSYYLLDSGYRIRCEDAEEVTRVIFKGDKNKIENMVVAEDEKFTTLKIRESYKGEYNLIFDQNFYKDYKNKDFTVVEKLEGKVYLKFNDGDIKKLKKIKFEEDSVLKDMGKQGKDTISFGLKKECYGHYGFYDNEGVLNIKFRKKLKDIKGTKIILDPGHGIGNKGYFDPGALGYYGVTEHMLNVQIAKEIEKILKEKGAEVVRLNTTERIYSLKDRPNRAFIEEADLFISLHHNAGNKKLNATEVYYNTSFSKEIGLKVNGEILKVYKEKLFNEKDEYDRGTKWDYYTVLLEKYTPSILIEVGYIDNLKAFEKLNKKENARELAKGIVRGIEKEIKG